MKFEAKQITVLEYVNFKPYHGQSEVGSGKTLVKADRVKSHKKHIDKVLFENWNLPIVHKTEGIVSGNTRRVAAEEALSEESTLIKPTDKMWVVFITGETDNYEVAGNAYNANYQNNTANYTIQKMNGESKQRDLLFLPVSEALDLDSIPNLSKGSRLNWIFRVSTMLNENPKILVSDFISGTEMYQLKDNDLNNKNYLNSEVYFDARGTKNRNSIKNRFREGFEIISLIKDDDICKEVIGNKTVIEYFLLSLFLQNKITSSQRVSASMNKEGILYGLDTLRTAFKDIKQISGIFKTDFLTDAAGSEDKFLIHLSKIKESGLGATKTRAIERVMRKANA